MVFLAGAANTTSYEIDNSLRFNHADTAFFSRNPASDGSARIMSGSVWVKLGPTIDKERYLFACGDVGNAVVGSFAIYFNTDQQINIQFSPVDSGGYYLRTNRLFRDYSAWYHVFWTFDTTNGTAAQRARLYINGVEETSFDADNRSSITQNSDYLINQGNGSYDHNIGRYYSSSSNGYFNGYMAQYHFIDGTVKSVGDFGETDDNGVWIPKKYTGSYGTNGFFLEFKQTGTSANSSGMGADTSGNDLHWTPTDLAATDVTTDTPTNNFATMKIHGAAAVSGAVLAEGNLKCTTGTSGSGRDLGRIFISDILMSSGKWYWEAKMADTVFQIGLSAYQGSLLGNTTNNTRFLVLNSDGTLSDKADSSESQDTYMASISANDIVHFALDMDASPNVIYFGKGGSWGDGSGNTDEASPNSAVDISGGAHDILTDTTDNEGFIGVSFHSSGGSSTSTAEINFGNPSFSISSGNSDANGYGNFEYAVPSGYYALCTKNLAKYG